MTGTVTIGREEALVGMITTQLQLWVKRLTEGVIPLMGISATCGSAA